MVGCVVWGEKRKKKAGLGLVASQMRISNRVSALHNTRDPSKSNMSIEKCIAGLHRNSTAPDTHSSSSQIATYAQFH